MIDLFLLIVILGLVTYRVARFIVLDTLIDGTRDKTIDWLERRQSAAMSKEKSGLLWAKLTDLIGCPFCITIWVAAGALLATRIFVGSFAMPVWVWLATAASPYYLGNTWTPMTDVADRQMSDREMREATLFLEDVMTGSGPLNAAIAVGWSPAKLKRLMQDPEFSEMVDVALERRLEGAEKVLWQLAQGGHFKALQMVLFNQRSEVWRDVRHIQVERHDQLDIGIVVSVKEAALASLREAGVAAFQAPPAVIEVTSTDAADG